MAGQIAEGLVDTVEFDPSSPAGIWIRVVGLPGQFFNGSDGEFSIAGRDANFCEVREWLAKRDRVGQKVRVILRNATPAESGVMDADGMAFYPVP